jgi:hypothetical protein
MKFGYIDKTGEFVIQPIFFKASNFSQGIAFVNIKANQPPNNNSITLSIDGFVINKTGQVISQNFANTMAWRCSKEKYFPAIDLLIPALWGGNYYFIDSSLNHFPKYNNESVFFENITSFSEGLAGVYRDSCWRVIKINGQLLNQETYEDIKLCSDGLLPVKKAGKWKFLNKKGGYEFINEFDSCNSFRHKLAYVEIYEANSIIKGYIDIRGKYIWQTISRRKYMEEKKD